MFKYEYEYIHIYGYVVQMLRFRFIVFLLIKTRVISPSCHRAGTSEPGGDKDTFALAELSFQSGAELAAEGGKNEADGTSLQVMPVVAMHISDYTSHVKVQVVVSQNHRASLVLCVPKWLFLP